MTRRTFKHSLLAGLAVGVLAGLTGCSGSTGSIDAAQLAKATTTCLMEGADPAQLFSLGEQQSSGTAVSWRRLSVLGCPGTFKYWTTPEFREAVSLESTTVLIHREPYRQGLYTGLSPKEGVPVVQRDKLGAIGLLLEKGAVSGSIALSCKAVSVNALGYMSAMSYPFAMAAIGTQMPSLTDSQVYDTAEALVTLVGGVAKTLVSTPDCAVDVPSAEKSLERFAEQMVHFQQGKSPYTPGCRAEVLMNDVKVVCADKALDTKPVKKIQ